MARPKYPHLLTADVPVWERWLAVHGAEYNLIEYDVRVGTGRDPGEDITPNIRTMAIDLSKPRIDAIAYTPSTITIIEITQTAKMSQLGQLQAYPILYQETYKPVVPIRALLVCSRIDPDLKTILNRLEIPYDVL